MEEPLAARLRAWESAGLIDAASARAIAEFEAARRVPVDEARDGVSASEALTYVGVAVALAGLLIGIFTGVSGSAIGPVILVLAAVGALLGMLVRGGGGASSRRASGAALTVAAALAALGTGELLDGAGVFATPSSVQMIGDATVTIPGQSNLAALTAISAAVALVLLLVVLRIAETGLGALLAAFAAYTTGLSTAWAVGREAALRSAWSPLLIGAFLLFLSTTQRRDSAAAGALRFLGFAGASGTLLVLGQIPDANPGLLITLAAAVSVGAVVVAVRAGVNELAVAGGLGIFGVALDVTARTLGRSAGAPVVLIVSGLLLVACAVVVQQVIRQNRARVSR